MLMKLSEKVISKTYQDLINKTAVFAKYRLIFNGLTNTHSGPLTINISNYVVLKVCNLSHHPLRLVHHHSFEILFYLYSQHKRKGKIIFPNKSQFGTYKDRQILTFKHTYTYTCTLMIAHIQEDNTWKMPYVYQGTMHLANNYTHKIFFCFSTVPLIIIGQEYRRKMHRSIMFQFKMSRIQADTKTNYIQAKNLLQMSCQICLYIFCPST